MRTQFAICDEAMPHPAVAVRTRLDPRTADAVEPVQRRQKFRTSPRIVLQVRVQRDDNSARRLHVPEAADCPQL